MSKKYGKSEEARDYLSERFSGGFTFEEAKEYLADKDFPFNKQTVTAMKKKGYLTEEDGNYFLNEEAQVATTVSTSSMSEWEASHRRAFVCTDPTKHGVGDFFTVDDLEGINNAYSVWKSFNQFNLERNCRRMNLPELLTEGLASALLGMPRTNNVSLTNIDGSADLVDTVTGAEIQIKGISTSGNEDGGPTSFGPRTEFGRLIVVHVKIDEDKAYFYELDASEYKTWKVNKNETIEDQQKVGKRPRLTLLPKIKEKNIQPFIVYSYKTGDVERYDKNN